MAFIEDRNSNDDPSDDLNFDNYFTDLTPDESTSKSRPK